MASAFSVYWASDLVEQLPPEDPGPRLRVLFGGTHQSQPSFRRARVEVGDRLFVITLRDRRLHVLGSMRVEEIQDVEMIDETVDYQPPEFAEWHFLIRSRVAQVVVGREGTPIRRDRVVPPDVVLDWTFLNRRGERPLGQVQPDGTVTNVHGVMGIYELHPDTAQALERLTGRGLTAVPG